MVIQDSLPDLAITVEENGDNVILKSDRLTIHLAKKDGHLEYFTTSGTSILKEDQKAVLTPITLPYEQAFNLQQNFHWLRTKDSTDLANTRTDI